MTRRQIQKKILLDLFVSMVANLSMVNVLHEKKGVLKVLSKIHLQDNVMKIRNRIVR